MLALVGAGRRADALDCYRRVYRRFVDELGVEPGRSLQELQQRILRGESLQLAPPPVGPPIPRQLPPAIAMLTGRDDLRGAIAAELQRCGGSTPPVIVLVGPGGVGKTTLALAVGHGCAGAFPDGQLYGDLRGSRDDPADPHTVAGRFLRALGVDGVALPQDRDERLAMYRSVLAGKRVLVVLDDAATEEQLRPLVPPTAGCAAVITSRHRLGALVGVARWTTPVLAPQDAVALLAGVIGRERVAGEPDAAAAIVGLCALLPLAVSVAAARLAVHPHWRLAEFRQRLAAERNRLDELSVGDLDVRASIALSYHALDPGLRRLFRRLGLIDAPDWPAWVAGALAGAADAGEGMLDQLVDVHLVESLGRDAVGQSRFRLHDLVAAFARERALAEDDEREQADALSRLLSGWLALASVADEHVAHHLVRPPERAGPVPSPDAARLAGDSATDWFEAERRSLVCAVDQACRSASCDLAGPLALRLSGFLALRSYDDDWDSTLRQAISCVRERGHRPLLVRLLDALFVACLRRGRYQELAAIAAANEARGRALDDPAMEVRALINAGRTASRHDRFGDGVGCLEQAVAAARRPGIAGELLRDGLTSLALIHLTSGHALRALPLLEEARTIDRDPTPSSRTALQLYQYGVALTAAGRLEDAERALGAAQRMCTELGGDLLSAYLEQALADVDLRQDRRQVAAERLDRALRAHQKIGNDDALAETLRSLGDLAAAEGRWADAIDSLRRALDIWRGIHDRVEIARTLARLERAHATLAQQDAAEACRQEYRTILTDLELDDACLYPPLIRTAASTS